MDDKDTTYSPGSDSDTEQLQDAPSQSPALDDPDIDQSAVKVLPGTGLSTGLREVLQAGAGVPWGDVGLLALWAVVAGALAAKTFRWE